MFARQQPKHFTQIADYYSLVFITRICLVVIQMTMIGAVTTLDGKLFHISTVLCVNEYFLMSSLECDLYSLY
jgi:hypothetical protein